MSDYSLISFKGAFFKRVFKGQHSGPLIKEEEINGNDVNGVLDQIFNIARENFQREIVCTCDGSNRSWNWSEKMIPDKSDVERYVLFQDKTKSVKKTYKWTEVKLDLMRTWRDKTIGILIHVHSVAIGNSSDYDEVKLKLLEPVARDRSGAPTYVVINTLVRRLQDLHHYLDGPPIAWKLWATYILTFDAGEQEELMSLLPPTDVGVDLRFRRPNNPQLVEAQTRMNVANNINRGYNEGITQVRQAFNQMMDFMKIMDLRIKYLEDRNDIQADLLNQFQQDLTINETAHSVNLASQVQDAPDPDHD